MRRARLLLTNDDGIDAEGIQSLCAVLAESYEVLVVAPMYEKSGAGCSLSLADEMEVRVRRDDDGRVWGYAVDGTPAECVKFAVNALKDFRPDLVVSGINRGMNVGNSVFYSGTVAGAIEATMYGHRAVACSLNCWGDPEVYFTDAARVVARLLPWFLEQPREPRTFWNLNLPNRRLGEHGRVRFAPHGTGTYEDDIVHYRDEGDAQFYRNVGRDHVVGTDGDLCDGRIVEGGDIALSLLRTDLTVRLPEAPSLEERWNRLLNGDA